MPDEPTRKIKFDPDYKSYRSFFDKEWGEALYNVAAGTPLVHAAMNLTMTWKAASNTQTIPSLMVTSLEKFWISYQNSAEATILIPQVIRYISARLCHKVEFTNMKRKAVQEALDELAAEAMRVEQIAKQQIPFSSEDVWQSYIEEGQPGTAEFILVLWGSQRFCYSSLFHGYENFIREVLAAKMGKDTETWHPYFSDFSDLLKTHFDASIAAECTDHRSIKVSLAVRNALAHNGGQDSDKLRKINHGIQVFEGQLQVMPHNNKALFDTLKSRALILAKAAAATLPI